LSFTLPWLVIGIGIVSSLFISYIPEFAAVGQEGVRQFLWFLEVFGKGSPLQGLLLMSLAFSFVCVLFDVFAATRIFYSEQ